MRTELRYRLVEAREPDADPSCRLTREEGLRRRAETDRLFSQLVEQKQSGEANEFVFHGNRDSLWEVLTVFVDEESICCPFFTFEQTELADGVLLRVRRPGGTE